MSRSSLLEQPVRRDTDLRFQFHGLWCFFFHYVPSPERHWQEKVPQPTAVGLANQALNDGRGARFS
jgi:hypothetical protein